MPAKKKTSKAETTATAAPKAKAKKAATGAAKKKAAAKKAPAKKAAAKKAPAKKAAAKKAPAKKAAAKKTATKKATAKKAPAKKAATKKAPAKKAAAKKAPAKKAAAKETATKVAKAKKSAADDAVQAAPEPKKGSKTTKASDAPASDHDAAIARIEAKAEAAGVPLAKGASAAAIKAAEKALGAKLPEEVVAFYRRHDGAEDDPAVEGRELLSLSRMVDEWKIWKDLFDQGTFEANDHGRPDPGVQQKWWIPEWVPVTYDGAGNHHVIDLAPADGGTRGQILSFWHDDDPRTVVAKDFLAWLEGTTWGDRESDDHDQESAGEPDEPDEDEPDDDEPASEAAGGDFRRFEMDEKFWSVRLDGDSFTVRFGKRGTDGQEQVKSFDDEATARKEHDKLLASKVKKGYREV